ncbi:LysM domain-containing protein [Roseinatronobacter thiooxidans]|uniref:LysM domain-containing protein n=1 Tax=Roseinatronobacter thiooxidans TaxID=121821 RepID=A0A2W7RVL6_9RHOB|nr:LysM peptidoglycan-binding domain-containing protein [Roseinatronobacter thiooxidans]PZX42192.1 LysM domain-containing protein [Roseinatronobacter thiooxidans]
MLKYFPKDTLAQWLVGSVAVAGAASVAYVLVFPSEGPQPDLPAPSVMLGEPAHLDLPLDAPAPDLQLAMVAPAAGQPPSFDIMRMTDLGDVLIAGKAPALSAVSALIDENPVAQTVSTAAGEFVLMFEVQPSPMPRVLELEVRLANGDRLRSLDTLMLAPRSNQLVASQSEGAAAQPLQTARVVDVAPLFPEPGASARRPVISEPRVIGAAAPEGAAATDMPPELQPTDTADPRAPLAVLMRADGTVQVLGEAASLATHQASGGNVSIDAVTYDAGGEVALSGRSRQGAADIQIYLDNQPILRARASADGNWQAQLEGIERGVYRLRVDELDDAAQVTSRAEIPFQRVTPEIAREATGTQALIVQPGNTLWAMSQEQFGDGRRFMRIFDANRDQIRNPDLIYPGQVFVVPQTAE